MSQADRELDRILSDHYGRSGAARKRDVDDDAAFQEEMKQLEAEGKAVILSGVDPAARESMTARTPIPFLRRLPIDRRILGPAAIAAALIPAVLLLLRSPESNSKAPTTAIEVAFLGGISEKRGEPSPSDEFPRYAPNGEVAIRLTETKGEGQIAVGAVRVFLIDGDKKLALLPLLASYREEPENKVVYELKGNAGALFGARAGVKWLQIALAANAGELEELNGAGAESARQRVNILWKTSQVEFILPSSGARETRILRYAWLLESAGSVTPVFTSHDLPRVQIRGDAAEPWALTFRVRDREPERLTITIQKKESHILLDVVEMPSTLQEAGELELWLGDTSLTKWTLLWDTHPDDYPLIINARASVERDDAQGALELLADAPGEGWTRYFATVETGRIQQRLGLADKARESWQNARGLAEALQSPSEAAGRLRACAYLDLENGEFARAREELDQALVISSSIGDEKGVARAEYYGALLLQRQDAPDASRIAQEKYSKSLESAYERGDEDDTQYFAMLLATAQAEQGDVQEAQKLLDRFRSENAKGRTRLDYALNTAYVDRLAFELAGRAPNLAASGKANAISLLEKSSRGMLPSDRAYILSDIIRYALALSDLDSAEKYARTLQAIETEKVSAARWERDLALAELALESGRLDGLEEDLQRIQRRAEEESRGEPVDISFIVQSMIGELKLRRGDHRAAQEMFLAALDTANILARHFAVPRARTSYRIRRLETAHRLAEMWIAEQREDKALELIERERTRTFELLAGEDRAAGSPGVWKEYLGARLGFEQRYPKGCEELAPENSRVCARVRAAVETLLNNFYADTWSKEKDQPRESRVFDFRRLPKNAALLSVVKTPKGLLSFWARGGRVRAAMVPDDPLTPWDGELAGVERIYLSVDDDPRLIEELPLRPIAGRGALASRIELIALAHGAQREERTSSGAAIVVADPRGDLPEARAEAQEVAKLFRARPYLGADADRRVIPELRRYPALFHFSGHGREPVADDGSKRLDLHGDEPIHVADILAEGLAGKLVVLSACASGTADKDSRFGLPDAFVAAGAHYVLATISDVSDVNARKFVEYFYKFEGAKNPPRAFRQVFEKMQQIGEHVAFRLWSRGRED